MATGAAPTASSRAALNPPMFKEKPPESGGFSRLGTRENPNGLLDIAESLC